MSSDWLTPSEINSRNLINTLVEGSEFIENNDDCEPESDTLLVPDDNNSLNSLDYNVSETIDKLRHFGSKVKSSPKEQAIYKSCFAFHEVKDKRMLIRIVQPSGILLPTCWKYV